MENPFDVSVNAAPDMINHPGHYCREGAMESIDEMEMIFGGRAVMDFCLLNAWKYRYRSADKNGRQDIEKSDWYMKKFKELKRKYGYSCTFEILYCYGGDNNDGK